MDGQPPAPRVGLLKHFLIIDYTCQGLQAIPLKNARVIVLVLYFSYDENHPEPTPRCSSGPGRMAPRLIEKVSGRGPVSHFWFRSEKTTNQSLSL